MREIFKAKKGEEIEGEIVRIYEELSGDTLYEGDAIKHIIKANSYLQYLQGKNLQEAIRMNFLKISHSHGLDLLGEFKNVKRLEAEKAQVIIRFSREAYLDKEITIPSKTRVTPDGLIYFETVQTAILEANNTYVDIVCQCQSPGLIGNNFEIGQIKILVDRISFITKVSNINKSSGGRKIEGDDSFRERIQKAPESFSVAGSEGAYEFWARSADGNIIDVFIDSPSPCVVKVYPLMKEGTLPDSNIINLIQSKLSSDKVRPITDKVEVLSPSIHNFSLNIEYYIPKSLEAFSISKSEEVEKVIDEWIKWLKLKLGRDINTDELIYRLKNIGVKRVNIINPNYTALEKSKVAICTTSTTTFKGVEDD